jgi:sulfur-carrier protein adenylyltransferase/sulfurtransferase
VAGAVPSCAEGGVLGVLPGVIGCIQATEAIKVLTGMGEPLSGRLLIYNALTMRFREAVIERDPSAPVITSLQATPSPRAAEPPPVAPGEAFEHVSAREALERFRQGWGPFVLDVRLPQEAEIVSLPFTDRLCPHREIEQVGGWAWGSRLDFPFHRSAAPTWVLG